MKKLLLLAAAAFVAWNTYSRPQGSDYFHPGWGESQKYAYRGNSGYYFHARDGTFSASWGKGATIRNMGIVNLDGNFYQKITLSHPHHNGERARTTYSRLKKDGIYSRKSDKSNAAEYLELPLPPKVGLRWKHQVDNEYMESEIAAIEPLEISGKTYEKCLKVTSWGTINGLPAYSIKHYAPDIGLVKLLSTISGGTFELILFEE